MNCSKVFGYLARVNSVPCSSVYWCIFFLPKWERDATTEKMLSAGGCFIVMCVRRMKSKKEKEQEEKQV